MSRDYDFWPVLGVEVSQEEFDKAFGKTKDPVYELQDRWDPLTGRKSDPVNVLISEGGIVYSFEGIEDENFMDFVDRVAEKLGIGIALCGHASADNFWFIFHIPLEEIKDSGADWDNICLGNSLALPNDVYDFHRQIVDLTMKLAKLGLEHGPVGIHQCGYVS